MGRRRQSRRDLPERVYFKSGAYWYVAAQIVEIYGVKKIKNNWILL